MKLLIPLVMFVLFTVGNVAWAADAKAGKAVYDTKCKSCHGAGGEGNAALAKTLKVEIKPFGSKEIQAKTDDQIKKQITQGGVKMQPVKGLSDTQVQDVIAFVRLGFPLLAAGDAQAGKVVYDSKCKTCHGAGGEGNAALAKTLKVEFKHLGSKQVQAKTNDQLKKESTEGIGKMQPVKGLSDTQVQDLIAFVRSLAKS